MSPRPSCAAPKNLGGIGEFERPGSAVTPRVPSTPGAHLTAADVQTAGPLAQEDVRKRDEMRVKAPKGWMQFGEQHSDKDTQSFLESTAVGLVPAKDKSLVKFAPKYGEGHEHLDTKSGPSS